MKCNLCGASPNKCTGWLERVNPKGEAGIYECRPSCGHDLHPDIRVIGAIEGMTGTEAEVSDYYRKGGLHPCYD